ncbi:MAG: HAD family hydrolase [Candidatus Saliniplasma sp.]
MSDKGRKTMLIFDLDGTLFKTRDAVVPAVQESLEELGIPSVGEDKIISLLGESTSIFSEKVMEGHEDKLEDFMDIFWLREKENVDEHGKLFDGTQEMLEKLRSSGYALAVCSNGSQEYVDYVLHVTGISDYFDLKVSSSQHDNKGAAVREIIQENNHSDYIMIGDKHHDFQAGKDNNILSIGVKYGYGEPEELKQADYLVESPEEIPDVVSRIGELLTTL